MTIQGYFDPVCGNDALPKNTIITKVYKFTEGYVSSHSSVV
jgi:hypothetical protein